MSVKELLSSFIDSNEVSEDEMFFGLKRNPKIKAKNATDLAKILNKHLTSIKKDCEVVVKSIKEKIDACQTMEDIYQLKLEMVPLSLRQSLTKFGDLLQTKEHFTLLQAFFIVNKYYNTIHSEHHRYANKLVAEKAMQIQEKTPRIVKPSIIKP